MSKLSAAGKKEALAELAALQDARERLPVIQAALQEMQAHRDQARLLGCTPFISAETIRQLNNTVVNLGDFLQ